MAADPVREGLAEVWDSGGRKFVTFEFVADGRADSDRWVQWLDGELNFRWPYEEDPRTALPRLGVRLPTAAQVEWHVPGENACLGVWDVPVEDVASLVRAIFDRVLGGGPRCDVVSRVESHS